MKEKIPFFAFLLILISGLGYFLLNGGEAGDNNEPVASTEERQPTDPEDIIIPGLFVNYSKQALTATKDSDKNVLFFHSHTCVVCDQIERNINAGKLPDGVNVLKVQMEDEPEVLKKYGVNLQTHFIQVDNKGEVIKEWNWLSKPFAGPQDIELEVI